MTGELDVNLTRVHEAESSILSLLHEIGRIISQDLFSCIQTRIPELIPNEERHELLSLLAEAEGMLAEANSPVYYDAISDESGYNISEIIEDTTFWIDCLMDLSLILDPIAVTIDKTVEASSEVIESSLSPEASEYYFKIRDRFPHLNYQLARAYSIANAMRNNIKKRRLRQSTYMLRLTDTAMPLDPYSVFTPYHISTIHGLGKSLDSFPSMAASAKGGQLTDTTKSTKLSSIFDQNDKASISHRSERSRSSSPSMAASAKGGRPRVPKLPKEAYRGEPFRCQSCDKILRNIKDRLSWKKHVFRDLEPYNCTFQGCERNKQTFPTWAAWVQHEITHKDWDAKRACPFCHPSKKLLLPKAYYQHVATHLQEISLAVIRGSNNEDESDESDESEESEGISEIGKFIEVLRERISKDEHQSSTFDKFVLEDTLPNFSRSINVVLHLPDPVGETVVRAELDSDTKTNWIQKRIVDRLGIQSELYKGSSIPSWTGEIFKPTQQCKIEWSIIGTLLHGHSTTFVVIPDISPDDADVVFGLKTIKNFGFNESRNWKHWHQGVTELI